MYESWNLISALPKVGKSALVIGIAGAVLNNKKEYKKMCEKIPLGRFGNVDEIITPMLFLASPHSSYVNGAEIVVDGGWNIL